jgi:hypothetical protein
MLAVWLLADSMLEERLAEYKALVRVREIGPLMDKLAPGTTVLAEPAGQASEKAGTKLGDKAGGR